MNQPLYSILRPERFEDVVGQKDTLKLVTAFLDRGYLPSMIFFGPPGSGKTTIARIAARMFNAKLYGFSAVKNSTVEIKKKIYSEKGTLFAQRQIVFVDEIHRYSKSQQDIFLPMIEDDGVVFIGATTENPSFSVNNALLSRSRTIRFEKIGESDVIEMLKRGLDHLKVEASQDILEAIFRASSGDLRIAINTLESAYYLSDGKRIGFEAVKKVSSTAGRYDKKGDSHYRIISAFIKSLRGSDPDAAMYYMMRMLERGEDPLFILRRMVIFASEDVGNADPRGLQIAVSGLEGFKNIGLPEGEIIMAQVATYLATAPKSNAAYMARNLAKAYVKDGPDLMPPQHIINESSLAPGEEKGVYRYPHDYPGHWIPENYFPDELGEKPVFYNLTNMGYEAKINSFREKIRSLYDKENSD